MDDFQLGLLVLGGLAIVGGLGLVYVLLTQNPPSPPSTVTNEETWEWTDHYGRRRTLTAHRKVESNERVIKL